MAKKKVNDTRANIESGMYFKFSKKKYYSYTDGVFSVKMDDKGTFHRLRRYHCHSKTGEYIYVDSVTLRRIGDTSMDYYSYDMFGKKTRGRIYYSDIDCFISVVKDKALKIMKDLEAKYDGVEINLRSFIKACRICAMGFENCETMVAEQIVKA